MLLMFQLFDEHISSIHWSAYVLEVYSMSDPCRTFVNNSSCQHTTICLNTCIYVFRMETIKFRSLSGIGKVLGVAFCLAGVITIALYRGTHIHPLNLHHPFGQNTKYQNNVFIPKRRSWIKGCIFMIFGNMTWSMWLVLQVSILLTLSKN